MAATAIAAFAPLDSTETSPLPGTGTERAKSKIGVFRPTTGEWFLDLDGDGRLDGCSVDRCLASFGQQGT